MRQGLVPALLLLTLSGCPPPRLDLGPEGEARTAEELLRRVDAAEASVQSLSGAGRLELDLPQGRAALGVLVEVAPGPGNSASLHLELLDFFGRPQLLLATDGRRFTLFAAEAGRWYTGPATRAVLARFLPLPVEPGELVALLLARVPRLEGAPGPLALDRARARYRLELRAGDRTQALEVDPASARVLRSSREGSVVTFSGLEPRGGVTFPGRLRLEQPAQRASLELSWTELTLGATPDPDAFDLRPPAGARVENLDGPP